MKYRVYHMAALLHRWQYRGTVNAAKAAEADIQALELVFGTSGRITSTKARQGKRTLSVRLWDKNNVAYYERLYLVREE